MPALDKGPKANCHGTALLASSAGIRQTPPAAKFGRQHQKLGPAPAVRHWRSCKILQVPTHTHPASNKISSIATDVVPICRRLLMGGCRSREEGSSYLRGRSTKQKPRCRGSEHGNSRCMWAAECVLRSPPKKVPPNGTYLRPEMERSGPYFTTGPRERALQLPSSRLLQYGTALNVPFSTVSVCPSGSINSHQHHIQEHCMTELRRQNGTFSIPDGQLTSALSPKLHFPQILSAKHPCNAARFPQSAPESFRSPGHHPWTNHYLRVGRGDLSIPAVRLPSCHTRTAQRLLQGMVFLSLLQLQDGTQYS